MHHNDNDGSGGAVHFLMWHNGHSHGRVCYTTLCHSLAAILEPQET